jgi:acetylornithine deacetylase/succinyl-diaminopimelate desuccinylase-like protein
MAELLDDLIELLRIPSVSAGRPNPDGVRAAAEWVRARVVRSGGQAELVGDDNPIVVGELRAARDGAPDVIVYGHYDVQDIGPPDEWRSDPFDPVVRAGRLYARGSSDDKGNVLPVLHAACAMHEAGELPVNVRVLIEGEEEVGSEQVMEWIAADERGADAAIVFDSAMADEQTPAITTACRGLVGLSVVVRVAERDLHSGLYGGAAMNAVHVLHGMLAAVLPGPGGRVRDELRAGIAEVPAAERESWAGLPAGERMLAEAGSRPATPEAAAGFYERTGAEPSLELNGIVAGAADELRTIIPASARANLSLRTAPGQRSTEILPVLEGLLREATPEGAQVDIRSNAAEPAVFDPESPALRAARAAFERATGRPPALVRSGGTIPILAAFAERGIQTIVSGFALPEDAIHAPNESYRLESLELGERTSRALFEELGKLR